MDHIAAQDRGSVIDRPGGRGDVEGYGRLASLLSSAQMAGEKGRPHVSFADLAEAASGRARGHWAVLTGCRKGTVPAALVSDGPAAAERELRSLIAAFGAEHTFVELWDHGMPTDSVRNDALAELAVDLREGGAFSSRMEAKDGSMGFDFAGTYTQVVEHRLIECAFGDRTLRVEFLPGPEGVTVRETFEAESTHSEEQQRAGWQAILDNFARHVRGKLGA